MVLICVAAASPSRRSERSRHHGRQAVGGEWNREQHDHDDRNHRSDRPADDLQGGAAIEAALVQAPTSATNAAAIACRVSPAAPEAARTGNSPAAFPADCRPDGCRHRPRTPMPLRPRGFRGRRRARGLRSVAGSNCRRKRRPTLAARQAASSCAALSITSAAHAARTRQRRGHRQSLRRARWPDRPLRPPPPPRQCFQRGPIAAPAPRRRARDKSGSPH